MSINIEIERKFLVLNDNFKNESTRQIRIVQGYICTASGKTVRVRLKNDKGILTIKGKSQNSGLSRFEWEKEIPLNEAEQLLQLCENGKIEKIRYEIPSGSHVYEVDVFSGDNEGLIIAEVELKSEDEEFKKPAWLGSEVTGDKKYYNSHLVSNPYKNWSK